MKKDTPSNNGINRDKKGRFTTGNKFGKGRPEGSYSLVTILKKKLAEAIEKGGKQAGEELVDTWLKMAKKDFNALKEMVHYTDGMPKQKMEVDTTGVGLAELRVFFIGLAEGGKEDYGKRKKGKSN